MDEFLTEHYDALDEQGLAEDPQAWEDLDAVRAALAEYGRITGRRKHG